MAYIHSISFSKEKEKCYKINAFLEETPYSSSIKLSNKVRVQNGP